MVLNSDDEPQCGLVHQYSKKNSSNQQPSKQAEQPISNTSEASQIKEISSPVNSTNSGIPISQPSRNNSMPNDRPNPISITRAELVKVNENSLVVKNLDLIDGTPVIDIKPYIPHYDSE